MLLLFDDTKVVKIIPLGKKIEQLLVLFLILLTDCRKNAIKGMPSVRIACLFSLGHPHSSPLKRFASSCARLAFFRYLFVTLMSVCRAWSRATTIPSAFARSRMPESFKL